MPIILQFIIVFFIFLAFFGLTHFFVYISLIKHFKIKNTLARLYLLITFSFLSFSFVVSSALVRYFDNFLTDTFYLFASLWSGLLVYLVMAMTLSWLAYFFNKFSPKQINLAAATVFLLISALATSIYGVVHAANPLIRYHDVNLENLPPSWQGRTAVHLTDLHIGAINSLNYANRIMEIVNKLEPDIVFITGDYFDGTSEKFAYLAAPLQKLHPPLGTFFVSGNHETYAGLDQVIALTKENNVRYLQDEVVEIDGLSVIGFEFPRPGESKNYAKLIAQVDPAQPSVLLYHEPRYIEAARDAGIDLQLAGHTHEGQQFPFGYITRWLYGPYHHGFFQEGTYHLNTTSGVGTWGPPIRVGTDSEITILKFK